MREVNAMIEDPEEQADAERRRNDAVLMGTEGVVAFATLRALSSARDYLRVGALLEDGSKCTLRRCAKARFLGVSAKLWRPQKN